MTPQALENTKGSKEKAARIYLALQDQRSLLRRKRSFLKKGPSLHLGSMSFHNPVNC
jgi:hypothetical protein